MRILQFYKITIINNNKIKIKKCANNNKIITMSKNNYTINE